MRDRHLKVSAEILQRHAESRYRDVVKPRELVVNLAGCLSDDAGYQLNLHAFSHHTANFRWDAISEVLGHLNISDVLGRLRQCEPFARRIDLRQAITELRISEMSVERERSARMSLSSNSILGTLDISIEGKDDPKVAEAYRKIEIVIEGMLPWYRSIARISEFAIIGVFFFGLIAFSGTMAALDVAGVKVPQPDKNAWNIVNLLFVAVGVGTAALAWCRNRIFPRVVFLIGQGKGRHETLENLRWTVVIGFLVSLASSIAYGFW